jgi:hypothetical protein
MRPLLPFLLLLLPLAAQDQPASRPTLSAGTFRYEWHDFGTMPPDHPLGAMHGGVVVTKSGEIVVNTDTGDPFLVFAKDGTFLRSFGKEIAGGIHGMFLREEDGKEYLYAVNHNGHYFAKIGLDGALQWKEGYPAASGHYTKADEFKPTAIVVAPSGDIFVADGYGLSYVHRYDKDHKWVSAFGGAGKEPEKFRCPHGMWLDTRGKEPELLIADRVNIRLKRYGLDGKPLGIIEGMFRYPSGLHEHGTTLAIADLKGRVTLLDGDNKLIGHLGDQPNEKLRAGNGTAKDLWKDGEFIAPHGVRFDRDGNLYVAEWLKLGRIVKLVRVGAGAPAGASAR